MMSSRREGGRSDQNGPSKVLTSALPEWYDLPTLFCGPFLSRHIVRITGSERPSSDSNQSRQDSGRESEHRLRDSCTWRRKSRGDAAALAPAKDNPSRKHARASECCEGVSVLVKVVSFVSSYEITEREIKSPRPS